MAHLGSSKAAAAYRDTVLSCAQVRETAKVQETEDQEEAAPAAESSEADEGVQGEEDADKGADAINEKDVFGARLLPCASHPVHLVLYPACSALFLCAIPHAGSLICDGSCMLFGRGR
jgi:hypothetical protein